MSFTFGLLLRKWRLEASLSQEALAELAQISPAAVSAYERGIRGVPHRATVAMLADVLGLSGIERADFEASAQRKPAQNRASEPARTMSNLPVEADSFFGRQGDVAAISDMLGRLKIVTITGDGGVGKTRTALAVAHGFGGRKKDGLWFADLGSRSNEADVATVVGGIFGIDVRAGAKGVERIAAALRERDLLIVLDNCEHVIGAAATLASRLREACPSVAILATSRERLRIAGEAVYPLAPLPIPPATSNVEVLRHSPAVQLFIERASVMAPEVAMPVRLSAIADICRAVDGIPLAIEIVASRVTPGGLEALRDEVSKSVGLNLVGNRDLPPRQRTMQATLDWSFSSLGFSERTLYRRLSAFSGGWTLEAAQTVCSDDALSESNVRDAMSALFEKALVQCNLAQEIPRYSMLQVHCAFAKAKAEEAGEHRAIADRHASWVAGLARHAVGLRSFTNRSDWRSAFYPELDNIRSALRWTMGERGRQADALEIVCGLRSLWYESGLDEELRGYFDELSPTVDLNEVSWTVVDVLEFRSRIVERSAGVELARRAVDFDRALGGDGEVMLLINLSSRLRQLGEFEQAERVLEQAFAGIEKTPKRRPRLAMHTHMERACIAKDCARLSDARADFLIALEFCRALDEEFYLSHIGHYLADVEYLSGNVPAAIAAAEAALEDANRSGSRRDEMYLLCNLAGYRIVAGDLPGAHTAGTMAVAAARGSDQLIVLVALQHLATVAALNGELESAARLTGFVERRFSQLGIVLGKTEARPRELLMSALDTGLSSALRAMLLERGAHDDEDQAVKLAASIRTN